MKIKDLLQAITALGLDGETEIVVSTTKGAFAGIELEVCDYECEDGDVIKGPDPSGWGGPEHEPRPLPKIVLCIDIINSNRREPVTF